MKRQILALALITPGFAGAEVYGTGQDGLSTFPTISVKLIDNATGGCWTNLGETSQYAKDKLKLAGANVVDAAYFLQDPSATLVVDVFSNRFNTGKCYGAISVTLESIATTTSGHSGYIVFSHQSQIFTGYENANIFVLERVGAAINELAENK